MNKRPCIFYREPQPDRWMRGDHIWRAKIRRVIRGAPKVSGMRSVYINLLKGLDRLGVDYVTNIEYSQIRSGDWVGVVGVGNDCLVGYDSPNPILAGVAVAEHPAAWPSLFDDFPVAQYVVHSDWVRAMYERCYGPRVAVWPVGIDTERWAPSRASKSVDVLVYDKVMWDHDRVQRAMIAPITETLRQRHLSYEVIRYGHYSHDELYLALSRSRAMLFLCEHETQGLAYQQALSCGVPVMAWDPGQWLDPWRFRYGESYVPATSVPYFDERCGVTFASLPSFEAALEEFIDLLRAGKYDPRPYVLENLTLERCAQRYLDLLKAINT